MKRFLSCLLPIAYCLLLFSSCNSYFTIEKRKYNKGFYVHRNIFHKEEQKEIFTQRVRKAERVDSDSVLSENISTLYSENNREVKHILTESKPVYLKRILFQKDTLPEKKNKDFEKQEQKKNKSLYLLPFFISLIAFMPLLDLEPQLAGVVILLGLIYLLIALIIRRIKFKKNHENQVGGNKEDSGNKRKVPVEAILGFILSFIPFMCIGALVISIGAIKKIKNNHDRYKGMGWAIAGIGISFLCIIISLFLLWILLFAFLGI